MEHSPAQADQKQEEPEQPQEIEEPKEEVKEPVEEDAKVYKMNFSVFGTKAQLKSIKEFLEKEGIQYE